MRKKSIVKKKYVVLCICLFLSVMLPVGILMIVFGFINNNLFMAIPGIAFAGVGFYVMPVLWIRFGKMRCYASLYQQIVIDNIQSVQVISMNNGWSTEEVTNGIKYLINNRFLTGYALAGDNISPIGDAINPTMEAKKIAGRVTTVKCSNCGAIDEIADGKGFCPYCGNSLSADNTTTIH